jgi:hypothetical protein
MRTIRPGLGTSAAVLLATIFVGSAVNVPRAHGEQRCNLAALQGNWGTTFSGVVTLGPLAGPAVSMAALTFDENGAISGSDVVNFNGTVVKRTVAGTASLNADCVGSATLTITASVPPIPFPPINVTFVVVERAKEIRFMFAEPAIVAAGSLARR